MGPVGVQTASHLPPERKSSVTISQYCSVEEEIRAEQRNFKYHSTETRQRERLEDSSSYLFIMLLLQLYAHEGVDKMGAHSDRIKLYSPILIATTVPRAPAWKAKAIHLQNPKEKSIKKGHHLQSLHKKYLLLLLFKKCKSFFYYSKYLTLNSSLSTGAGIRITVSLTRAPTTFPRRPNLPTLILLDRVYLANTGFSQEHPPLSGGNGLEEVVVVHIHLQVRVTLLLVTVTFVA